MGLPEIGISFLKRASNAIGRGSRGMVALILNDTTKEQLLTPCSRLKDVVQDEWTQESLKAIKLVFKGTANKVLLVRMVHKEDAADLAATLAELLPLNIDYLTYPGYQEADMEAIKEFMQFARSKGKKVKAVLPGCAADDAHVINFTTSAVTVRWEEAEQPETYTGAVYCSRIAGILAGLPLTSSCTYYVLPEVVDAALPADADTAVDAGELIVVFDGEKYKLGRGVTSLVTVTEEMPEELKKIKIVEGMDVITHDIYKTFEDSYVGQVVNSYDNKQLFVGAVNDYLRRMQGTVLDASADNTVAVDMEANREYLEKAGVDTSEMTEQELREANTGSAMYLTGSCRFLDAAEDLTLRVYM